METANTTSDGGTQARPLDTPGVRRIPTTTPWAAAVGYSRALRFGPRVLVSGTAPVNGDGSTFAKGDAHGQTRRCIEIIGEALRELGADLSQVVRTRIYVTDIARWEEIGRAHGEAFGASPPVTTMVEVQALIAPDMLVEIEAEAWVPD
jgi:enamine deaminase RidA (YjgF/YER057c/UK114 family)